MLVGAPVGIGLVASIALPAMTIGMFIGIVSNKEVVSNLLLS